MTLSYHDDDDGDKFKVDDLTEVSTRAAITIVPAGTPPFILSRGSEWKRM